MNDIGKRIKTLRQLKGWSQGDVAEKLDISVPAFSKIEADITGINLNRLGEIATIFEMSVVELIAPDTVNSPTYVDELKIARDTIDQQTAKIFQLQEYVITLYEELHQLKKHDNAGGQVIS